MTVIEPSLPAIPDPARPVHALVFHHAGADPGRYSYNDGTAYITSHPVIESATGPVLGAGALLSVADQEQMLGVFAANTARAIQILPENVLYASARRLVWYVPGRVRVMLFRTGDHLKRLNVPWPTLVLSVTDRRLSVAALASPTRPHGNSPIYHAPLGNVHREGGLCTGSADLPEGVAVSDMAGWEAVVFDTAFSHVNQGHTLKLGTSTQEVDDAAHLRFWKALAKSKAKRFPTRALVRRGARLGRWLQQEDK